jgi:hypothetical protein
LIPCTAQMEKRGPRPVAGLSTSTTTADTLWHVRTPRRRRQRCGVVPRCCRLLTKWGRRQRGDALPWNSGRLLSCVSGGLHAHQRGVIESIHLQVQGLPHPVARACRATPSLCRRQCGAPCGSERAAATEPAPCAGWTWICWLVALQQRSQLGLHDRACLADYSRCLIAAIHLVDTVLLLLLPLQLAAGVCCRLRKPHRGPTTTRGCGFLLLVLIHRRRSSRCRCRPVWLLRLLPPAPGRGGAACGARSGAALDLAQPLPEGVELSELPLGHELLRGGGRGARLVGVDAPQYRIPLLLCRDRRAWGGRSGLLFRRGTGLQIVVGAAQDAGCLDMPVRCISSRRAAAYVAFHPPNWASGRRRPSREAAPA